MVIFYSYVSLPEGNFQLFLWSSPNMHLQERLASQQSVPRNVKPFVIPNSTEIHTLNIKQTNFFQAESPFKTRVLGAEISLQNPGREGLPKIFVAHLQRLQAGTQGTS